jgi:hypothetical protein
MDAGLRRHVNSKTTQNEMTLDFIAALVKPL